MEIEEKKSLNINLHIEFFSEPDTSVRYKYNLNILQLR